MKCHHTDLVIYFIVTKSVIELDGCSHHETNLFYLGLGISR